ncbi:influenza virus NS1A-binding protein homolog A-like isoform X2 [Harmonia axyridis]|uniref:influenza virus NS1A-binding protein homolog A-like isoform X2 n=1 Tax=Harmonia axyridis TaxID=115357 RepID=UPI001E278DE7|nr:influenza virus NS1A-binding protein homolog A-like isoform X2 [Harmonia axyridis]
MTKDEQRPLIQYFMGHNVSHNGSEEMRDPETYPEPHLEYVDDIHKANTLQSLNMMRKNRQFCDVILHVENVEVHAHKAVLASASPYLFELFTNHELKRSENCITYKLNGGFDKNALEILVDYAYTAKLEVHYKQVKSVFLAANQLKMERVSKICAQHLIKHLNVDNCIEIRSLPGIARNKEFMQHIDAFIAKEFTQVSKLNNILNLHCIQIEILSQSKEEMSMVNPNSLFRLILTWIQKQITEESLNMASLLEKPFMLYIAIDNSLQDCSIMPAGDISNTEIVQDYRKKSLKDPQPNSKNKRKILSQPSKPRVLICKREIGIEEENEFEPDWNLIAADQVGDHSYLGLVTIGGRLTTISLMLRLNVPSTPSPVTTPISSRPGSEEKPDFYCGVANMSSQRCAFGCGNVNNTLFVCGGYDRTECLRTVEQYIPETNIWKQLPTMRESRGRFKIAVLNDKVYALGGSNGTTELASVEMLDLSIGKWVVMPPLPLARSNSGVCTLNNLIYFIGGWNGQVGIKQCDVFNPETSTWGSIAPLHTGRYQAAVTAYNNQVFAIGGCDAWNCLNSVEVYRRDENVWSFFKPIITARRGCGVAVFNNKIYVVGGSDGTHSLNSTEVYDEETQTWVVGPTMTTPRANVEVAVVGDRLYAVGGFSGKNFLNTIEYLDLKSNEWTTFIPKCSSEILIIRKKPRSRKNSRKSISDEKSNVADKKNVEDLSFDAIQIAAPEVIQNGA